jgi:hypothetical protein
MNPSYPSNMPAARAPIKIVWHRWQRFGRKIGDIQARFLLSSFYFTVFALFALAVRWGSDPLGIKSVASGGWRRRDETTDDTLKGVFRQS